MSIDIQYTLSGCSLCMYMKLVCLMRMLYSPQSIYLAILRILKLGHRVKISCCCGLFTTLLGSIRIYHLHNSYISLYNRTLLTLVVGAVIDRLETSLGLVDFADTERKVQIKGFIICGTKSSLLNTECTVDSNSGNFSATCLM